MGQRLRFYGGFLNRAVGCFLRFRLDFRLLLLPVQLGYGLSAPKKEGRLADDQCGGAGGPWFLCTRAKAKPENSGGKGPLSSQRGHSFRQIGAARAEEQELKQQLQQQQLANAALQEDLSRADDLEFIKELARDQLGMAEQGERIFYDVND